jgi:hypothetical protein
MCALRVQIYIYCGFVQKDKKHTHIFRRSEEMLALATCAAEEGSMHTGQSNQHACTHVPEIRTDADTGHICSRGRITHIQGNQIKTHTHILLHTHLKAWPAEQMPTFGHARSRGRLHAYGATILCALRQVDLSDGVPLNHLVRISEMRGIVAVYHHKPGVSCVACCGQVLYSKVGHFDRALTRHEVLQNIHGERIEVGWVDVQCVKRTEVECTVQ